MGIKSFDEYRLEPPIVFSAVLIGVFSANFLTSILSAKLWAAMEWDYSSLYIASLGAVLYPPDLVIVEVIVTVFLASWAAKRLRLYPYHTVITAIAMMALIGLVINLAIDGHEALSAIIHQPIKTLNYIFTNLVYMVVGMVVGSIGVAHGLKHQHTSYLHYLLKNRQQTDKDMVATMAYNQIKGT